MTKMDHYFCPFCNLYPVEYVYGLNIFPFLYVYSTCVKRKNIYYKRMFRELCHTMIREYNKRLPGAKKVICKVSMNHTPGFQKYTIVSGKPGFNKKIIFKSFCMDQTKQNYEYAFAMGPEITYAPSNDEFLKSRTEEISEVQPFLRKEESNDNLIPDKNNNLNKITYYSNSNASTKYDNSSINNLILKLSKHDQKNKLRKKGF